MNVIKYLRKHLEEALAAPEESGVLSWDGTEGKCEVVWGVDLPTERVWVFRFPPRRPPIVIGDRVTPRESGSLDFSQLHSETAEPHM